jgi:hypothetical protein
VKTSILAKTEWDLVQQAREKLTAMFDAIPDIQIQREQKNERIFKTEQASLLADFTLEISNQNTDWQIVVETKNTTYLSRLSTAILQLSQVVKISSEHNIYPVLIVPWLSDQVMSYCANANIGCMDLEGNFRLVFGGIYALSRGAPAPMSQQQSLKSLFSPKSSRVLRTLLRNPKQTWRIQNLAQTAEVSLGHAHKVKLALEERGWLEKQAMGIYLSHPKELLEAWTAAYSSQSVIKQRFYTLKHGKALNQALQANDGQHWLYASFSAADWLAPFARQDVLYLVADTIGLEHLQAALQLEPVESGFNVVIMLDAERDILQDHFKTTPNIWTTSPVQTYLELMTGNDRSREAAARILKICIEPNWKSI